MSRILAAATTQRREVTYEPIEGTDGLLSTVYNVEVCMTGIEYPLASGPATFTPEDLVEAVASQNDPAIQSPRVWLGHPDDDRFHAGRATPAGSAEPALGKVINMRVEEDGHLLVGDIAGCPTWLAKILSTAYPSRSIEGYKDATTVTGKEWKMVVTDLALLGVRWPGVSTLEDLQALYSEDGPDDITIEEEDVEIAAARAVIQGQINIDDVRRAFYANVPDLGLPAYSWIRAMQLDPNELIVDDDDGNLYAVSFTIDGDDVEFGDPVKKKIQYVNASQKKDPNARALLTAMFTDGKKVAASWTNRTESRPDDNNDQEVTMTPEQLRASIGLPADATDEQVTARIAEINAAAPTATSVGPGGTPGTDPLSTPSPDQDPDDPEHQERREETTETDKDKDKDETESRVPVAASALPQGHIAVPADAWAMVQANAAAGARTAAVTEAQRRANVIEGAVKEGRIAPSQKDNFAQMFLRDPQGTETLLTASVEKGGLMPGTIPVEARGVDPSAEHLTTEAYPASWLPELANQDGANITVEA